MNRAIHILQSSLKARPDYPRPILAQAQHASYNPPDASAYERQATLYQKLTWIATAIDTVAAVAALGVFSVKERKGEELEDIPNHDFELLLQNPNPAQSQYEFWRDYFSYRKLTGNAYVFLNRESKNDVPDELWIIPSHLIRPIPDGNSYIRGYLFEQNGQRFPLETWQIMHDKSFNPHNPFIGLSPLESLAIIGVQDLAQQRYGAKTYDKDNAKIPGALAFADNINQTDWDTMRAEAKEQWGGTNRSGPMWLRNVGAGGVQWLQMAMSPEQMQAIEMRNATKEEIWGKLCKGLASVLAINATEANALAGKAIMAEYEIWPMLVQAAQKTTKNILPAYADNLVGEFDDVRKADRLMDITEQQEYEKSHTVNEIRVEYYGDDTVDGGDVPVEFWRGKAKEQPADEQAQGANPFTQTNPMDNQSTNSEVQQEMKAWENFALKRLGKAGGREFEPRAIAILDAARIRTALKSASTPDEVRSVFSPADELKRQNDLLERALTVLEK